MRKTAFVSVDDFRRSYFRLGAAHPAFWIPASMIAFALLVSGLGLIALAFVCCQTSLLVGVLRARRLRAPLARRVRSDARRRAAETLDVETQRQWHSINAIAERTAALGPRRAELEPLLDTFVNLGLALSRARSCADRAEVDIPRDASGPVAEVARERRRMRERMDASIAALRAELAVTAQLVYAVCESEIAERCESCAELWRGEVAEARRLHEPDDALARA